MPGELLDTFEVDPTESQRGSVIWMHGLGATNHDFDDVVPLLEAPYLRFVFPQAPARPVTVNHGMVMPAWYDILSFDDPSLREERSSVLDSAVLVEAVLAREVERGVPSDRIVLAGFSQGGAMALHVGLRHTRTLAGVAVLSGYLVLADEFEATRHQANAETPFLLCHGRFDPVVPFGLGTKTFQRLEQAGANAEFHAFDMQHSLCIPEITALRDWLSRRFPG